MAGPVIAGYLRQRLLKRLERALQRPVASSAAGAITLGLTIPLFDGGATRNASHRARLELLRQQITLEEGGQTVGVEVRRVREDFKSAQEQLSAAETQQQTAERAVHAAEERFKSGVAPLVELTQARTLFLQAKTALAATRATSSYRRRCWITPSAILTTDRPS